MRTWWLLVVLGACGRIDFALRTDGGSGDGRGDGSGDAAPPCTVGAWGSPQRLTSLASTQNDWGPALSVDGLTLVYDSGMSGSDDLYVSLRSTLSSAFGAPVALTALNDSAKTEYGAAWLGQDLYYDQFDPSASTLTTKKATYQGNGVFGAPSVVPESMPVGDSITYSVTGLEAFYTVQTGASQYALKRMTRPSIGADWVGDASLDSIAEGGTDYGWGSFDDQRQTLYFERTLGANPEEIVETTRQSITGTFGTPVHVETGGTQEGDPEISKDGLTLLFASVRSGGAGLNDIYMMRRTCQ